MPSALLFGASGQIGRPLLARLLGAGWEVVAVSRQARREPGTCWITGQLPTLGEVPGRYEVAFSCGPLDHFAAWYARHGAAIPRVVAFGSTSVETKRASADAGERDLAARLAAAEQAVFDAAARTGAAATVLRPTLVYGRGEDHTLTTIAALGRRLRVLPLPRDATGLRQPVHVDDLAGAALAAATAPAAHGRAYALPGGETLPFREMAGRVAAALDPPARVVGVPSALFRGALAIARLGGRARGFGREASRRLREDLVFDPGPAARDFDYAPRRFAPTADMFRPVA